MFRSYFRRFFVCFEFILGMLVLKSLGKELEMSSQGERRVSPFVGKIYDISNAALFYAHNGRLDNAREQLSGQWNNHNSTKKCRKQH